MLEEALSEGDRALIFTQFAEWGAAKALSRTTTASRNAVLYGSTKKQREEMIDRFQHDPKVPNYDSLTQSRWRRSQLDAG